MAKSARQLRHYPHRPDPLWKALFILALEDGCSASAAAARAGVSRVTAYKARRSLPAFAQAWDNAYCYDFRRVAVNSPEPIV